MKRIKTKFIAFALASAFIALSYSTVVSADSVTSTVKTTTANPTLTITPRSNVELQGGSTVNGCIFG
jgi:phosphate-selective porin